MDTGSILSEPSPNRGFSTERSASMSALSQSIEKPRMTHLETLEAKMANIEVSLSGNTASTRRRKGISMGSASSTISARVKPRPSLNTSDTISLNSNANIQQKPEHQSAMQEREAIIQNLRLQLGLGKLPRPTGTPLNESEIPAAEQRLQRLRIEADNKRNAIRSLKTALDNLDVSDNIDMRIRQAELEYALGREELQLLSLVEEIRALQSRLEKSTTQKGSNNPNTLFNMISTGTNLTLHAIQTIAGRFSIVPRNDASGLYVEWTIDGEGLFKGDRIIEVNGKIIETNLKDECMKIIGKNGTKCEFVVVRKRQISLQQQKLIQSQEDNQRLQHRISYLEDQVKELLNSTKEKKTMNNSIPEKKTNGHITSINISSERQEKPQIYQRGNFVTTIIDGNPITPPPSVVSPATMVSMSKPTIKETVERPPNDVRLFVSPKPMLQQSHSHHNIASSNEAKLHQQHSAQKQANIDNYHSARREQKRREYELNNRYEDRNRHSSHPNLLNDNSNHELTLFTDENRRYRKEGRPTDIGSVKSLDFGQHQNAVKTNGIRSYVKKIEVDYTSEPVIDPIQSRSRKTRPTPPKKPLRLSLQRAQSLQTIETNANVTILDLEKKRAMKRSHCGIKTPDNSSYSSQPHLQQTASLGRSKNY